MEMSPQTKALESPWVPSKALGFLEEVNLALEALALGSLLEEDLPASTALPASVLLVLAESEEMETRSHALMEIGQACLVEVVVAMQELVLVEG
jgi:hypothetical protein